MPKITNDVLAAKLDAIVNKQSEHTESLSNIIYTLNGRNGQPGLITRLDRIEQTEARRVWHIRTLWATVLAGLTGTVLK